ncbi:hypothetical protein [Hyphomonas sp.]|uniref:hypothetical protein n=1 Tax=Hyphomonas sp. TaxID=87 RepID=UPI0025BF88AF|nr:hypothetical protein [Hyphomonas sp.]MBI1401440.1 hypothetical protein [Hyphomonas sp.]
MIDEETRRALEIHLTVALQTTAKARFRELAKAHGTDGAARLLARDLAAGLAAPFDITPRRDLPAVPSTRDVGQRKG